MTSTSQAPVEWEEWYNRYGEEFVEGLIVLIRSGSRIGGDIQAICSYLKGLRSLSCRHCKGEIQPGDLHALSQMKRHYCLNCVTSRRQTQFDPKVLTAAEMRKLFPKTKKTRRGKK